MAVLKYFGKVLLCAVFFLSGILFPAPFGKQQFTASAEETKPKLTSSIKGTELTLSWTSVSNATGYQPRQHSYPKPGLNPS
jgi:hypothetical protein